MLAVTDFKLQFYGCVFGYLWSLARPFALFGVIYFVFTEFAKFGEGIPNYGAYILFALVLFQFFIEITTASVQSLVDRENLIRKVRFPRLAVPFSVALTALFNLGMTLLAVFVFALASGVTRRWTWLELPLLVLALLVFATRHRHAALGALRPLPRRQADLGGRLAAAFYASPVLYVTTMVPADLPGRLPDEPDRGGADRDARGGHRPRRAAHVWDSIGDAELLLIPAAIVAGAFALGWWSFNRAAPRIAEHL